jgi:DNA primase catalytic subunit
MRSILISALSIIALGGALVAQSSQTEQPSLGEVARQQRAAKKAAKAHVFTNEDLTAPKEDPELAASPTAADKPSTDKTSPDDKTAQPKDEKKVVGVKAAEAALKKTPVDEEYRAKVQKQRSEIEKIERELADLQHTQQVQSTNSYMDAGSRLRDPQKWTEQRNKVDKDITEHEEQLHEARNKLDDLIEEARKLGVPESSLE